MYKKIQEFKVHVHTRKAEAEAEAEVRNYIAEAEVRNYIAVAPAQGHHSPQGRPDDRGSSYHDSEEERSLE